MILAIEPTSLIVVLVFVLVFLGAAYGLKTRKGSGINEHPDAETEDTPREPGEPNPDSLPEEERGDSTLLDQHGQK